MCGIYGTSRNIHKSFGILKNLKLDFKVFKIEPLYNLFILMSLTILMIRKHIFNLLSRKVQLALKELITSFFSLQYLILQPDNTLKSVTLNVIFKNVPSTFSK